MHDKARHQELDLDRSLANAIFAGAATGMRPSARAVDHVIDCIAVTWRGAGHEAVQTVANAGVVKLGDEGPCTVLGTSQRGDIVDATLMNAMSGHVEDFDDDETTHSYSHVTVPCLSAAWAAAEAMDCDGTGLLAGYVAGVETIVALGKVLIPSHYHAGWHATATLGVFGAAAATAVVLGADADRLRTALSLASTRSAGLRSAFGSDAKPFQVAASARAGAESALLAMRGMSSSASIFGHLGYAGLYAGSSDRIADAIADLPHSRSHDRPGIILKAYPCCSAAHTAIEAALQSRRNYGYDLADISGITLRVSKAVHSILVHDAPLTGQEGKFSAQYCVAIALRFGSVELQHFQEWFGADEDVSRLIHLIKIDTSPTNLPDIGAELVVTTKLGQVISTAVERPLGSPYRPLSSAQLEEKFLSCIPHGKPAYDLARDLPAAASVRRFSQELQTLLGSRVL